MSDIDVVFMSGRGMGKTTAICKAAKEIGAVVLTHSRDEARRLAQAFGVTAVPMSELSRLRGMDKPFLFDTHAAASSINDLEARLAEATARADRTERDARLTMEDAERRYEERLATLRLERDQATARAEKAERRAEESKMAYQHRDAEANDLSSRLRFERDQAIARAEKAQQRGYERGHAEANAEELEVRHALMSALAQARAEAAAMREALNAATLYDENTHPGSGLPWKLRNQMDEALASAPQAAAWLDAWEEMERALGQVLNHWQEERAVQGHKESETAEHARDALARARNVREGGT